MKKIAVWSLFLVMLTASGLAVAMTPDEAQEAHRKEMKAIKDTQRQAREAKKANPSSAADQTPGFWQKEGERSGLGGSGNRMGTFFKNLNPVPFFKDQQDKYNARKAGAK